jgi:hypothetical protein
MYLIWQYPSRSFNGKEMGILRARCYAGRDHQAVFGRLCDFGSRVALGVGLGIIFAKLSIGVVAQSLTDIYMRTTVSELAPSWGNVVADVLISVIASLAAAAFPALSTTRITPISAIRFLPHMQDGNLLSRKIKIVRVPCSIIFNSGGL